MYDVLSWRLDKDRVDFVHVSIERMPSYEDDQRKALKEDIFNSES